MRCRKKVSTRYRGTQYFRPCLKILKSACKQVSQYQMWKLCLNPTIRRFQQGGGASRPKLLNIFYSVFLLVGTFDFCENYHELLLTPLPRNDSAWPGEAAPLLEAKTEYIFKSEVINLVQRSAVFTKSWSVSTL